MQAARFRVGQLVAKRASARSCEPVRGGSIFTTSAPKSANDFAAIEAAMKGIVSSMAAQQP